MNGQVVTAIVVAVVILLLIAAALMVIRSRKSKRLRQEFGPEYDRTIGSTGKRRQGERDLEARKDEHAQLELRPLSAATRDRYTSSWTQVQSKFVDAPVLAVNEADSLVTKLMAERGYPTDDFATQSRLLSVDHVQVLESYRSAHEIELRSRAQQASTEDIRHAMLGFRRVFDDVLADSQASSPAEDGDQHTPIDGNDSSASRRVTEHDRESST